MEFLFCKRVINQLKTGNSLFPQHDPPGGSGKNQFILVDNVSQYAGLFVEVEFPISSLQGEFSALGGNENDQRNEQKKFLYHQQKFPYIWF